MSPFGENNSYLNLKYVIKFVYDCTLSPFGIFVTFLIGDEFAPLIRNINTDEQHIKIVRHRRLASQTFTDLRLLL